MILVDVLVNIVVSPRMADNPDVGRNFYNSEELYYVRMVKGFPHNKLGIEPLIVVRLSSPFCLNITTHPLDLVQTFRRLFSE